MNPLSKLLGSLSAPSSSYGGLFSGPSNITTPTLALNTQKKPAPTQAPASVNPTTPTTPTPPTSTTPPAKQRFVDDLSKIVTPKYLKSDYRSPGQIADDLARQNGTPTTSVTTQPPVPDDPMTAYAQYLKGFRDKALAADTALANVQTKKEQAETEARRAAETSLDTPGGTTAGASQATSVLNRRNNATLADIALQESAAARTANVAQTALTNAKPLQIGDNFYDPSTGKLIPNTKTAAGFSLSPGEIRYEKDPTTGQYKAIATTASTPTTYQSGTDPNIDAWVANVQAGKVKLTDVPKQYQDAVGQAVSQSKPPISEATQGVLSVVSQLLNSDTNAISGVPSVTSFIPGTQAQKTKNLYDQLKGMLSLQNRQQLKGSGAISDFESKTLEKAASSLGTNLSDADFKRTLQELYDTLSGANKKPATATTNSSSIFAEQW